MLTLTTKPTLPLKARGLPAQEPESELGPSQFPDNSAAIQRKAKPGFNSGDIALDPATGKGFSSSLPSALQARMEAKAGVRLDDVRVHHNSPLPERIGAHAFTKGTDIHLGPGEDKHLPHEAWHTVQQKQGRVRATDSLFGIPVNDQSGLESEADAMASRTDSQGAPAMAAPIQASGGSGEGVVQGVFMKDDGETAYSDKELDLKAIELGLTKTQITEMKKIHGYKQWRYLSNWLEKNEIQLLPPSKKRGHGKTFEDEELSDEEPPVKVKKVTSKKKKKVPIGTKKKIFQNNLGFGTITKTEMSKRKYYPTPDLDFTPLFPKVKKDKKTATKLALSTTMSGLKDTSSKHGFRGNTAPITFRLAYTQDNKSIQTEDLKVKGVKAEYESSDHFSGTKKQKEETLEGIKGLHSVIGLKVSKGYGPMLHSERNMVFQFDKKKIDEEIISAITAFAKKKKKIKILTLLLVLYSDPNEICTNCGTALHALAEADNIVNLGERLDDAGLDVDDGFSLKIITGAKSIGYNRKFKKPFVGKPEDLPSVLFSYEKE